MKSELQITFRNIKPSEQIAEWIRTAAAKLESVYGRLMSCHVTVELPHSHHKKGSQYQIRLRVTMPQGEVVVNRQPSLSTRARQLHENKIKKSAETSVPHKDLRAAINDAFKAAGRRLQDYGRRQRGDVKTHELLPEARVSQVFPRQGYGFLTSADGREIYFHKNSVLGEGFARLKVGTRVRYAEEPGEKGPQASTVHIRPREVAARRAVAATAG